MPLHRSRFLLLPLLICFFVVCRQSAYGTNTVTNHKHACYNLITDTLPGKCPKNPEIEKIITEAISLGAPIYNEGLHMACYRVYEWAGYKILYEYGKDCKEVEKILKTAIDKSHGDYSDTEKAWLMRQAFDKILGEPTQIEEPKKSTPPASGKS